MMRHRACAHAVVAMAGLAGIGLNAAPADPDPGKHPLAAVSETQRGALLQRAKVWRPTDIPAMDLLTGPPGGFAPHSDVTCDYVAPKVKLSGTSPKFECTLPSGGVVRVKYGDADGEVYAEVAATRLFWALGFGADPTDQVRVTCRNCPKDPWKSKTPLLPSVVFEHATIQRKMKGEEIAHKLDQGWKWGELRLVDASMGGATAAEIDGFRMLAVFVQHSDNKAEQQRFICLPEGVVKGTDQCTAPFLLVHDLGATFGRGVFIGVRSTGTTNYKEWSALPLWKNPATCRSHLEVNITRHSLDDPVITEAGRQFLAALLVQLTDKQIRDMFDAGSMDERQWSSPQKTARNGTLDQWVEAFKARRDALVRTTCPR
jgi:hypothetical protein